MYNMAKDEAHGTKSNETTSCNTPCHGEYEQTNRQCSLKLNQKLRFELQHPQQTKNGEYGFNNSKNKETIEPTNFEQRTTHGNPASANIKKCDSSVIQSRFHRNEFHVSLTHQKTKSIRYFKSMREKSFLILFGIVLIFLTCNIPRLLVKLYIIVSGGDGEDHFEYCLKNNRLPVPAFMMIMGRYCKSKNSVHRA